MTIDEVQSKSILTPTGGFLHSFDYSLNPYFGCRFGCSYCYAASWVYDRNLRNNWGHWLKVKANAAALLEQAGARGKLAGTRVYMSSVTDPYQPEERRAGVTRACLDVMVRYPPALLVVQTRSPLVARDVDLLDRLGDHVLVAMSITTDDESVRRLLEPACAPIAHRVAAITRLKQAGIRTQASVAPLLPCDPERLAEMLDGAVDRIVVSTFTDDGGAGSKTRPLAHDVYRQQGWELRWLGEGYERPVVEALKRRLGERVSVGKAGFNV